MECRFKVGDYVERVGYPNSEAMPVGWKGNVKNISDDGDWLWFGNGQDGLAENFKLVEEEPKANTPEITVGSKWEHKDYKSFIVSVFHVNSNGTVAVKVENTGDYYKYNRDDGAYGAGNVFVYNENEYETIPFTNCYTPYTEPKTIVRYVGVLKRRDSGNFCFTANHYNTAQETEGYYNRCLSGVYDLITIKEVKYTEGEE